MRNHRGFTLVEILVSLVIMGLVTGAIYGLLATTQRVTRQQTERAELQSNIRAGAIIVPAELREINVVPTGGPVANDIITLTGTGIQYRAMRGFGWACQPPTLTDIILSQSTFSGYRDPQQVRDGAYVFLEGAKPHASTDDSWLPVTITAVTTNGNLCPGGTPSIRLTVAGGGLPLAGAGAGAAVRTYEVMNFQLFPSAGEFWLGAQSISGGELIQPVLGPLTGDGFALQGLDSLGVPTAVNDQVRSIQVTIKGLTDQAITKGTVSRGLARVRDSLVTQVTLRNALR